MSTGSLTLPDHNQSRGPEGCSELWRSPPPPPISLAGDFWVCFNGKGGSAVLHVCVIFVCCCNPMQNTPFVWLLGRSQILQVLFIHLDDLINTNTYSQILGTINHCIINSSSNALHPFSHLVSQRFLKQNVLSSLFEGFGWWDLFFCSLLPIDACPWKTCRPGIWMKVCFSSGPPCYGIGFSETKKGDGGRDTH